MHRLALLTIAALSLTACKGEKSSEADDPGKVSPAPTTAEASEKTPPSEDPIQLLRTHLSLGPQNQPKIAEQGFATMPLTKAQAEKATELILEDRLSTLRAERQKEFDAKSITLGDKTMRYEYKIYGDAPTDGHSLYISMHGGGGAPARVNKQPCK